MFDEVFQFVLAIAAEKKLLSGKTVGVDSTLLEANAAMKSIVRRDTGEDWKQYVTRLMREEGAIEPDHEPTDEEIRRFDKKRKNKKVSNDEWVSPSDPESRITQLKDGRTHLAYKAEHVVDLKSDLILAAEIYPADHADTQTLVDSVLEAVENVKQAGSETEIEEIVADKGYHAAETIELADDLNFRTYIPERKRTHRSRWTDKPAEFQQAVYANRRRLKRGKSRKFQRLRSERCRADVRPRLRHGRHAAQLAEGSRERQQTLLDRRRRAQLGPHPAKTVRSRQAKDLAGPRRSCRSCAASAQMALHV